MAANPITVGVRKEHVPFELRTPDTPVVEEVIDPLDSEAGKKKERKLKEWWHEARISSADNRFEQALDADFFDGLQWRDDDAEVLRERGQAPLVFNIIQQHIRWILGTERRTRVDFKVHGREKEDAKPAQTKTKLLKYTDDVNHSTIHRSLAFGDATKVGVGWLECGIRSDPTEEPLFDRWEPWRNMWNDPLAKEPDNTDARFVFRSKWVDEDIAMTMFPNRKETIRLSSISHQLFSFSEDDDLGYTGLYHAFVPGSTTIQSGRAMFSDSFHIGIRRKRVRLVECWYREPAKVELLRTRVHPLMSGKFREQLIGLNGHEMREGSKREAIDKLISDGHASVYDAIKMKVHVAIFTDKGLLQDVPSPYIHDRFPFTPIWAFRRDRDNQPYGAIRNMRDPQEDLNKRRSKALHLLSTNRVIADEDAVEDWDEVEEQLARADGIIKKARGSDFEIDRSTEIAREHVNLMIQDMQFLENTSGVTEENRGEVTNAISGKAIGLRQTQGSVVTADLFDNLRFAIQLHGEKKLSLIEQYYTQPKIIRITNDRGVEDFQNVNMPREGDDGVEVENDITRSKADFIVDTQDFRETARLAMFESMMNLIGQFDAEVQLQLLDLVIDMVDVPQRAEMVRRIRELNGQVDPDAPDAEAQLKARKDQRAEDAERDVREKEAEIATKETRAAKTTSDAAVAESTAMAKAAEIAEMLALNPELAAAVDELFASFKEESGKIDPNGSGTIVPLDSPQRPPNGGI